MENKEDYKLRRKEIIMRHNLYKKLMTIYSRELCFEAEKQKFYRDKIYTQWYYIDKEWYYHKLEIARRITADGWGSYVILDTVCDPAYAYKELSVSVYFGLNHNLSLERCQAQLNECYGKAVRKRGKYEF